MIAAHTRSHIFNTPLGVVQPGSVSRHGVGMVASSNLVTQTIAKTGFGNR